MRATPFEYRFRFWIHLVLFVLGFWAPWNLALPLDPTGPNGHLWGTLAVALAQTNICSIAAAFNLLLVVGIACAVLGAGLRTWGTAYLSYNVVQSPGMHGNSVVADGPYRFLRNPLYLGTWLHTLALALLMPPSGAVFAVLTIGLFQLRLILAEEPFLAAKLGQPYLDYCARVPRIVPALTPRVPAAGAHPHWAQAALGEIYMICVALSFATLGWRYNEFLLVRCVLISLGISLVVRAVLPRPPHAEGLLHP
jgi:protein-S-isoprenylcysteine O-methyltransferase Ste14